MSLVENFCTKPPWIEITVTLPEAYADAVANFLIEQGSTGIAQEDLRRQRESKRSCLKAYMVNDDHVGSVLEKLKTYIEELGSISGEGGIEAQISAQPVPEEDWNKKWKSFFQPINVTSRIVIKPSWHQYHRKHGEIVIELDPGMAFGTGTHPSTRLCLQVLDDISLAGDLHLMESLLDVGTGSGILAIAAALLGFNRVVGIDVDHTAIACARENAKRNGVDDSVEFSTTPIRNLTGFFTVIVANILPHTLIHMKEHLVTRLAEGGILILSGILEEKAREVIEAFQTDVTFLGKRLQENWTGLVFKKR